MQTSMGCGGNRDSSMRCTIKRCGTQRGTVGGSHLPNSPGELGRLFLFLLVLSLPLAGLGKREMLIAQPTAAQQTSAKAAAKGEATEPIHNYPELLDITASTGIQFEHLSSPEQKFIVESMSGGVALIDYSRDGWLDIFFTNAQSAEMALHGQKARSALYHNNHDGTFTDVTDKAGVGYPCWAMGASVGDYNNDGRPD